MGCGIPSCTNTLRIPLVAPRTLPLHALPPLECLGQRKAVPSVNLYWGVAGVSGYPPVHILGISLQRRRKVQFTYLRSHSVAALQRSGPLWPELNCAVILGTARVTLNVQLALLRLPVISGACVWSLAAGGSHSACTGRCSCIGASQVALSCESCKYAIYTKGGWTKETRVCLLS